MKYKIWIYTHNREAIYIDSSGTLQNLISRAIRYMVWSEDAVGGMRALSQLRLHCGECGVYETEMEIITVFREV